MSMSKSTRKLDRESQRREAKGLMYDAMDAIFDDEERTASLCRKALKLYPDCVDALSMLAELECETTDEYMTRLREAVEAGRRDLGPKCFKEDKGYFWGLLETRPFMRAMALLADALIRSATPEATDEAIAIYEEMLELNPNDNQGVRDWLVGCYLTQKRYEDASELLERYPDDWLAAPAWAKVLLAFITDGEEQASKLLAEARERNAHVEQYLTGRKRLPRTRAGSYSPGDESEALYCADMLNDAWKKHPKARQWLKGVEAGVG